MASKMTTATMAAVTSLTIPSVSSAAPTRSRTGTTSRIGAMTVGPVATSSAPTGTRGPDTAAELNANWTTTPVATNEIIAPTVTSRNVAAGASRSLSIRRWNAPSKTMIATERPTMACSAFPNESGEMMPVRAGRDARPQVEVILGTRSRAARTCARTPSPMIPATSGISSPELPATVGLHLSSLTHRPRINAFTHRYRGLHWDRSVRPL